MQQANKELNIKQEKFCQAYAVYRNATESAKKAGYSAQSAHATGYRLLQLPEIKERIEEIEKELETNIDVVAEIENQYTYAKNNGHTNSAIKALEVLSRVRSVKDEESIKTIPELEAEIVHYLEVLGEERTSKIFLKCKWFDDDDDGDGEDEDDGEDDEQEEQEEEELSATETDEEDYQEEQSSDTANKLSEQIHRQIEQKQAEKPIPQREWREKRKATGHILL
jgi:phage terminase small subunit